MESTKVFFKNLDWSVEKIKEVDNYSARYKLPDCEVQILYNDAIIKGYPQFDFGVSITTGILAAACVVIDPYQFSALTRSTA
ncbi:MULTISPECIES: hypothetical protein [unclassified Bartonella]|uniref:hypothetical protein n=1 Tax=unclassified Bartonella TaxID=2645622 RepID=UPI0035D0C75C